MHEYNYIYVEDLKYLPHPRTATITAWSDQTMQVQIFHTLALEESTRVVYLHPFKEEEYTTDTSWKNIQDILALLSQEDNDPPSPKAYLQQLETLYKYNASELYFWKEDIKNHPEEYEEEQKELLDSAEKTQLELRRFLDKLEHSTATNKSSFLHFCGS